MLRTLDNIVVFLPLLLSVYMYSFSSSQPLVRPASVPADMSLSFEFPGFHKQWTGSVQHDDAKDPSIISTEGWQHDLEDLSGDECEQQQDEDPRMRTPADLQQHVPSDKQQRTSGASDGSQYVPDAVLLLVVDKLGLRDVMALACCCRSFHESLLTNSSAMWAQQEKQLLGCGWPWAPFKGAKPLLLPPSLGTTPLLHLKTTISTSKVALQYFVMRKGYEFMLSGFEALWEALEHTAAAPAAAAAAAALTTPSAPAAPVSSPPAEAAASGKPLSLQAAAAAAEGIADNIYAEQQQQQQQQPLGGRALQRLVDKLALHSWELTYSGYSTALAARCDELANTLRTWQQQHQLPAMLLGEAGDTVAATAIAASTRGISSISSGAAHRGAATPSAAAVLPAAVLADCAGGILREIESVSGGLGAGELLAGEPELLLAATRRGPRPASAIALWSLLLPLWERYRRWLDLVTARCGLLGARVAAARQLAEPSMRGPANAALLPHLRNKGLLLFRGHVLLAYGLRRPLQEAALWLAAAASADASAWRDGGGCSESDLDLLLWLRKLLTELDVADGQDEEGLQHTHAKFRRCFGALLTKQRRSRCLPASAW